MKGSLIILVRHGRTNHNIEGRFQGQGSVSQLTNDARHELREKTVKEVRAAVGKDDARLWTSPLLRAVQTAEIIADGLEMRRDAIVEEGRVMEFDFGDWEGRLYHDIETFDFYGESGREGHTGETIELVTERSSSFLRELALKEDGVHEVVVTHGGVVRMLMRAFYHLNHLSMTIPNGVVVALPKRWVRYFLGIEAPKNREIVYFPAVLYKRGWYDSTSDPERDIWMQQTEDDVSLRLTLNPTDHRCCRMILLAHNRRNLFNVSQEHWPAQIYTSLSLIMRALAILGYHAQFQYAGNNSVSTASNGLHLCGIGPDVNNPEPNFPHIHIMIRNFDDTVPLGVEFPLREGKSTRDDFPQLVQLMRSQLRPFLPQIRSE